MTSVNLKFDISPDVIFQRVQLGESLLLDVKTLQYFAFDSLGTRIWEAMLESNDSDTVVDVVAAEGDLDRGVLVERTRALLQGLASNGLIRLRE